MFSAARNSAPAARLDGHMQVNRPDSEDPMRTTAPLRSIAASLATTAALLGAAAAPAAAAAPDPERNATTRTGWHWYHGLSAAEVRERFEQHGDRIVDLEVQSTSPTRFAVATVRNEGVYKRGWYWYHGQTADQLREKIADKHGRLIDIESYSDGGSRRFAAVMVVNSGEAAKNWHWYQGVGLATLKARLAEHESRLIDLESYSVGGETRYAAIMIRNSGVDKSAWWWWRNVPLSKVQDNAASKGARTFSLDRLPNGNYNALQIKRKGEFSAYETVVDARRAGDFVSQNAGRIVDLDTYLVGGNRRYTVVINDNADAFNARVRSLARESSKLRAGRFGMWVKQVGGPVSVSLGGDRVFEPASVLKTLHHLVLHTRLEAGTESLGATIGVPDKVTCPGPAANEPTTATTVDAADRVMMANSSNTAATAFELRYTRSGLEAFAASIGAPSTQISHTFGCGTPANDTTLTDLATMIEGAANGTLLPTASVRNRFFDTMTQQSGLPDGFDDLVTEEAVAAGKPGIVGDFLANSRRNGKGGSLSDVRAAFGRMLIPFKSGGVVVQRAFSYGHFYNCAACPDDDAANDAYAKAAIEKYRSAIRSAVATW